MIASPVVHCIYYNYITLLVSSDIALLRGSLSYKTKTSSSVDNNNNNTMCTASPDVVAGGGAGDVDNEQGKNKKSLRPNESTTTDYDAFSTPALLDDSNTFSTPQLTPSSVANATSYVPREKVEVERTGR